jgi:hypothetical protein
MGNSHVKLKVPLILSHAIAQLAIVWVNLIPQKHLQRGFSVGIIFMESLSHFKSNLLAAQQAGVQHGSTGIRITCAARTT